MILSLLFKNLGENNPTVYTFGSNFPQFKLPPSKSNAYLRILKLRMQF